MFNEDWDLNLEQIIKGIFVPKQFVYMLMEPMSRHTPFRVGGPAELFVCPAVEEDLAEVLRICRKSRALWRILGSGNNLLVSDKGCEGVVISTEQLSGLGVDGNLLRAGAGQLLGRAAYLALEHSLIGMEFTARIPGNAGGTSVMNVGVYGSEMKGILKSVRVMTGEGHILDLPTGNLELGYRTSCIPSRGYIVLEAVYELRPGDRGTIEERIRELAVRRGERQSLEYLSAGSTFKRPQGYSAGKLIEDVGLRGYQVGGAQVSGKHRGFVINKGHATAGHVMEFCGHIRKAVREIPGVELEMEVKHWGEF